VSSVTTANECLAEAGERQRAMSVQSVQSSEMIVHSECTNTRLDVCTSGARQRNECSRSERHTKMVCSVNASMSDRSQGVHETWMSVPEVIRDSVMLSRWCTYSGCVCSGDDTRNECSLGDEQRNIRCATCATNSAMSVSCGERTAHWVFQCDDSEMMSVGERTSG
jgi:hypothetical protein